MTSLQLDTLQTHVGVVGRRQLICVQTIDIARLTAHPVALVPGAFVAVGGRGPKGDSNESGKTSFLAAVSLLLGDPEWRLGGGGSSSVAALLFEPETAGTSAHRFAPASHGYVIGVFAERDSPTTTAMTVWCRLSALSPHVLARWSEGAHLAPGENDAERHLSADDTWRALGSKGELGAATYARVLYGDSPRVLAYVAKRGSRRSDPSLLQMNAGAFSSTQIGADLIRLAGRAGSFESDAEQRQRLDEAERQLANRVSHDADARQQESATLEKLQQRREARLRLVEAEHLWSLHFARGYLDVLKSHSELEGREAEQDEKVADAAERLRLATDDLKALDAPDRLKHALDEANAELRRLRSHEETARQAGADARANAALTTSQLDEARAAAAGWSGATLDACNVRLKQATDAEGKAEKVLWSAAEELRRAETALRETQVGGAGASEVIAALTTVGIGADGLLDTIEVDEAARSDWEPRLHLYRDAVLISEADHARALHALQDIPEAILILGNASEALPEGIASAPPNARRFLHQLVTRFEGHAARPAAVTDPALGVVVVEQHDEPQTGRANRIARAERQRQIAADAVAAATAGHEHAGLETRAARADLEAATAAQQMVALKQQLDEFMRQVEAHDKILDELTPQLEEAETHVATARLRVEAHEQARAKADAIVELRRSAHSQATDELEAVKKQREALQIEYWERGWGGTKASAEAALADEVRTENTLRRRAGDALLDALHALGISSDGSGAPTEELRRVPSRRNQLVEDPSGRQPPSFDTIVSPLRDWLDSHAERDEVMADRIERTQAQRAAEIELARHECSDLHDGLESLQDAVEQRVRQSLDEISAEFDKLAREAGGFGAELATKTYRPQSPQEQWRWDVTPQWRRSQNGRMLPYDSQMNTAQEKLFTVHLVLAALLAAPNPEGRVLIIDELGDSLGVNHRREVLRAIAATAREKNVLVLGTCQDSVLADAASFCDEILYFECPSKTDALNRPTRMIGFDPNGERVELAAEQIIAGRQLV